MDISSGSIAIFVKNIKVSKEFYHDLLGLPVYLDFGKNVIFKAGLAIWEIQDSHIIPSILGSDNIKNKSCNRFELYFESGNLEAVFKILKSNHVRFVHEIHEEPWGQKTIRFFDPDHHLIEIGESMRIFVNRFYEQGLSVEQVAKRTSVPVDEVARLVKSF